MLGSPLPVDWSMQCDVCSEDVPAHLAVGHVTYAVDLEKGWGGP
jgi:hypothetical protein